ncbi:MAG: heme ABC transporter ATP-binding protein [Phototrophicales bacterium]|nr:MAG: heme ABC transporter ATP-binding protein [Phototrophicales bacterium]
MSIKATQITVHVGNAYILQDVSLCLNTGELLAVVGPNGAGKSTLLKVLTGELHPHKGTISIDDKPLARWPKKALAQRRAVLPQNSTLSFGFTALQVVLLGRTPHIRGIESRHDYEIVHEAMRLTATDHLAHRVYTTLSGGERQRIQLARVLAQIWGQDSNNTRYLLLDEPTNNLDIHHQHSILRIARHFANNGTGVLAILHDLNLAAQYADRILVLDKGMVATVGTPKVVLTPHLIQNTFKLTVVVQDHPCMDCPLVIPVTHVNSVQEKDFLKQHFQEAIS